MALTNERLRRSKWNRSIRAVPFQHEFLTTTGTLHYHDDLGMYQCAVKRFLNGYDDEGRFEVNVLETIRSTEELLRSITRKSVLIVNLNSDHWLVGVDSSTSRDAMLASCSAQLMELREGYWEKESPKFHRRYNREVRFGPKTKLHGSFALSVAL